MCRYLGIFNKEKALDTFSKYCENCREVSLTALLQELHLRGNGMTSPPREALGSLQSLRLLSLDHNNFTRLERKSFGRLPVVFNLTLAHNQINNISMNAFEGLLQVDLTLLNA